jgi:hypothetical protein
MIIFVAPKESEVTSMSPVGDEIVTALKISLRHELSHLADAAPSDFRGTSLALARSEKYGVASGLAMHAGP